MRGPESCLAKSLTVLALAGVVLGLGAAPAQASRARYGTIAWEARDPSHPTVVTFRVETAWRRSYAWPGGAPNVGDAVTLVSTTLSFGDGTTLSDPTAKVLAVNSFEDSFSAEFTVAHTYPGDGGYTAELSACCRLSTLRDGNGDHPWTLQSHVVVDLASPRRSPTTGSLPVIHLGQSQAATFSVATAPFSGLTHTFAATGAPSGLVVNPPAGLTMSAAGVVNWTPFNVGLYALQVIATDAQGASIPLDFIISVDPLSATPSVGAPPAISARAGTRLRFPASSLSATGTTSQIVTGPLPAGASFLPMSHDQVSVYTFLWTPPAGSSAQIVCFQALDSIGRPSIGQTCTRITVGPELLSLSGTIRDFHRTHPDFNHTDGDAGLAFVEDVLGPDRKPVFKTGSSPTTVQSAASFAQWWNNTPGQNAQGATALPLAPDPADPTLLTFDSSAFYPIDGLFFGNESEPHNNYFTYEAHTAVQYTPGLHLAFASADDLWVFLNGRLVVTLSGVHAAQAATLDVDLVASALDLRSGEDYPLDVFYAHRGRHAPALKVQLNRPQWCVPPASWPLKLVAPGAFELLGAAAPNADGSIRLVPSALAVSAGAAWRQAPIVWERGFQVEFDFHQRVLSSGNPSEGFAFVLARAPGVGDAGPGLGYAGLDHSIAVEFDTLVEPTVGDPPFGHVSVHSRGPNPNSASESFSLGASTNPALFSTSGERTGHAAIELERLPGQPFAWLRVIVGVVGGAPIAPVLEVQVSDATLLDALTSGDAFIGLTAANGAVAGDTDVSNLQVGEFPISSVSTSALAPPVPLNVMQTGSFVVQARDAQGSDIDTGGAAACFDASITLGPHEVAASVADNDDGTYTVSYTPDLPGDWSVGVRLEGTEIAGSPYPLSVPLCPSPATTSALAPPAPVEIPNGGSFVVQARNAAGVPMTTGGAGGCFGVFLVLGSDVLPGSVTDNLDGTYTVSYTPNLPGAWGVFVRVNGLDIAGSPYSLTVQLPDRTPPSVTIDQAAGQPDPTSASPILFTVVFSEPVSGFAGSGVSFAGSSVGGSLVASVSGSGTSYTVSVTGMSGAGTVVASIPTGAASDAAGNPSLSSTSADNVVTFDAAAPLVVPTIADALSNGGDGDGVLELAEKLTFTYGVTDAGTGIAVTSGCIDDPTPADGCGAGSPVADGGVRQDLPAGTHAFCVYAADAAGNAATVCQTFSVLYSFTGFFAPIDAAPVVNVFKAGKAMPVKWQITDVNGVGIADPASFVAVTTSPVSCSDWTGSPRSPIFRRVKASPTPLYRGQGQWQLNWAVPASNAGTCQVMQLVLADAAGVVAQRTARFQFK